jgi:hypothetical protein
MLLGSLANIRLARKTLSFVISSSLVPAAGFEPFNLRIASCVFYHCATPAGQPKKMPRRNTLAYQASPQVTKKISFVILTPGLGPPVSPVWDESVITGTIKSHLKFLMILHYITVLPCYHTIVLYYYSFTILKCYHIWALQWYKRITILQHNMKCS